MSSGGGLPSTSVPPSRSEARACFTVTGNGRRPASENMRAAGVDQLGLLTEQIQELAKPAAGAADPAKK